MGNGNRYSAASEAARRALQLQETSHHPEVVASGVVYGAPIFRDVPAPAPQPTAGMDNNAVLLALLASGHFGQNNNVLAQPQAPLEALPAPTVVAGEVVEPKRKWLTRRKIIVGATALSLAAGATWFVSEDKNVKDVSLVVAADQMLNGDGSSVTLKTVDCTDVAFNLTMHSQADVLWNMKTAPAEEVAKADADPQYPLQTASSQLPPLIAVPVDQQTPDTEDGRRYLKSSMNYSAIPISLCDPESQAINMRTDDILEVDLSKIEMTPSFPLAGQPGAGNLSVEGLAQPFPKPTIATKVETDRINAAINDPAYHEIVLTQQRQESLESADKLVGSDARIMAKEILKTWFSEQAKKQGVELKIRWKNDFQPFDETYEENLEEAGIASSSPDFVLGELREIIDENGNKVPISTLVGVDKEQP